MKSDKPLSDPSQPRRIGATEVQHPEDPEGECGQWYQKPLMDPGESVQSSLFPGNQSKFI